MCVHECVYVSVFMCVCLCCVCVNIYVCVSVCSSGVGRWRGEIRMRSPHRESK